MDQVRIKSPNFKRKARNGKEESNNGVKLENKALR